MDMRLLESFLAVVDHGSMAEAARRLAVTPAAIAQRIHAFESDIGEQMLVRVGRTVQPTQAGTAILARGRALLHDMRELRVHATGGGLTGELRVGSISTALTGIVPAALKQLSLDAPTLDVFIEPGTSNTLFERVSHGLLDVALLVRPAFTIPKTLGWRQVRTEPLVALVPSTMAELDPDSLLRTEPFIRYDRNHWGGRLADKYLRRAGIKPRERFELDALDAIAVMVSGGLGVSLVPQWAPPWPNGLSIACLSLPGETPVRRIGLLWQRASPRLRAIQALADALVGTRATHASIDRGRRCGDEPAGSLATEHVAEFQVVRCQNMV